MGVYTWYLYGYAINASSAPISVSAPDCAPNEQERAAFAIGLAAANENREDGPEPKAPILAAVASLFAEADPDSKEPA